MDAEAPVPAVEGKLGGTPAAPSTEVALSGAPAPSVSAGVVAAGVGRIKDYSVSVYGQVRALALIAPPINFVDAPLRPSRGDFSRWPVLLVAGDSDEYCSATHLSEIAGENAATVVCMPGVAHFLQGETAQLAAAHAAEWVGTLSF